MLPESRGISHVLMSRVTLYISHPPTTTEFIDPATILSTITIFVVPTTNSPSLSIR
jgi:hypothetical protein